MSNLTKVANEDIVTLDSREVAQILGKEHWMILRDIEGSEKTVGIIPILRNNKLVVSKYFIESNYKTEGNNKIYKCYLVTKMGCELIGNKQQGEKGILFTAKYVERFNQMEQKLKHKSLSPMDQLRLQYEVLENHEQRFEKIEERLDSLEINPHQKRAIQRAKSKRVIELLGGRKSKSYKDASLRAKVYADMGRQYNNYFDISEYAYTPRNRFEEALELISTYNLTIELSMEVKQLNNQLAFA